MLWLLSRQSQHPHTCPKTSFPQSGFQAVSVCVQGGARHRTLSLSAVPPTPHMQRRSPACTVAPARARCLFPLSPLVCMYKSFLQSSRFPPDHQHVVGVIPSVHCGPSSAAHTDRQLLGRLAPCHRLPPSAQLLIGATPATATQGTTNPPILARISHTQQPCNRGALHWRPSGALPQLVRGRAAALQHGSTSASAALHPRRSRAHTTTASDAGLWRQASATKARCQTASSRRLGTASPKSSGSASMRPPLPICACMHLRTCTCRLLDVRAQQHGSWSLRGHCGIALASTPYHDAAVP